MGAPTPIERETAATEADLRRRAVDLADAFRERDWATVARIYREAAALAERLEALDPAAHSRTAGYERIEGDEA